jgi:hypothetical protein
MNVSLRRRLLAAVGNVANLQERVTSCRQLAQASRRPGWNSEVDRQQDEGRPVTWKGLADDYARAIARAADEREYGFGDLLAAVD